MSFLTLVGGYALAKGEVSEKLALRRAAAITSTHDQARPVEHWLPAGLDDPRFDFSPKEESGRTTRFGPIKAAITTLTVWAEGLAWVFAPLCAIGAVRVEVRSRVGRWLLASYAIVFVTVLSRHAMNLGYLSGRHGLTLLVATLPWTAAGCRHVASAIATRLDWAGPRRVRLARWAVVLLIVAGGVAQGEPSHASRWGHRAAGTWLAANAEPGSALLDTRGWAAFVSGLPSYDTWHIRQALSDQRLAYVVVGADELEAKSRRAETLRALLAYSSTRVASFPGRRGGTDAAVLVFRFEHPESWEGIVP